MKVYAHWQTDVLAGFVLGTSVGAFMHGRDTPLLVSVLPGRFTVGFNKRF